MRARQSDGKPGGKYRDRQGTSISPILTANNCCTAIAAGAQMLEVGTARARTALCGARPFSGPKFARSLTSEEQAGLLYHPYSWTIKQVVGDMLDVQKVFGNRAHRFACDDLRPILGMEQNHLC